jgi:branched-subunit amino acid aminotransferase/4-amino-4-deoxychorismate lyase
MNVSFNGRIVDEDQALVPFMDRGVLFGDGLFETIRLYQGKPFRLGMHLARFHEGCGTLGFSRLPEDRDIELAISELYRLNVGSGDGYCRLTLIGGAYDGDKTLARPGVPNSLIAVTPLEPYPSRFYEAGMRMIVSGVRRNEGSPLSRLKSTNYLNSLIAKQEAAARGADDAVMLNNKDVLTEGTASNLFFVTDAIVKTPDLECGLLPGITREVVLELCGSLGLPKETGFYALEDLLGADEAFITVSTGEVVPIGVVEGSTIGGSCPGPITRMLSEAYGQLVRKELGL